MRRVSTALLFCAASLTAPSIAAADEDNGFFIHQQEVLEARGYRNIQAMPAPSARVTAIDPQGSEVIVVFNPDQGTIHRIDYVRAADR